MRRRISRVDQGKVEEGASGRGSRARWVWLLGGCRGKEVVLRLRGGHRSAGQVGTPHLRGGC